MPHPQSCKEGTESVALAVVVAEEGVVAHSYASVQTQERYDSLSQWDAYGEGSAAPIPLWIEILENPPFDYMQPESGSMEG